MSRIAEEKYQEAFEKWEKEHPSMNINDVKRDVIVTLSNGEEVKLGLRFYNMRRILNKKKNGSLTPSQIDYWFNEKGLILDNKRELKKQENEEKYQEALEIWLKKHPGMEVNDVKYDATIKITGGETIKLGSRITKIKSILKGNDTHGVLTPFQLDYWIKEKGLKVQVFNPDYAEYFGLDKEKMLRISSLLRDSKKTNKKHEYGLDEILKMFDIDLETLNKELSRIKSNKNNDKLLNGTLHSYCIKNCFNYEVTNKAIKLHQFCEHDSLEQLINRVIVDNNTKGPSTWIYEKYGKLIKDILLYLDLDSKAVLRNMSYNIISLEEAMKHDIFRSNIVDKQNEWLEALYNILIEKIDGKKSQIQIEKDVLKTFKILIKKYKLNQVEINELWYLFNKYTNTMLEYKKVDVGLETNEEKRNEKIKKYNFDEYDIEECYFIPLEFDKNVLIGRKSKLYERRQLLRQYIIDWDSYKEEEKNNIIADNKFTKEEIKLIEKTRNNIDKSLKIIKKKR